MRREAVAVLLGLLTGFFTAGTVFGGAQNGKKPHCAPTRPKKKTQTPSPMRVAYDPHDRRYYALTWAKAHGMRDPGGDKLIPLPADKLPPGANPAIVPGDRPERMKTPKPKSL